MIMGEHADFIAHREIWLSERSYANETVLVKNHPWLRTELTSDYVVHHCWWAHYGSRSTWSVCFTASEIERLQFRNVQTTERRAAPMI